MKLFAILVLMLQALAPSTFAKDKNGTSRRQKLSIGTSIFKIADFSLEIEISAANAKQGAENVWGSQAEKADSFVRRMTVKSKKWNGLLPFSSYSDLRDVYEAELVQKKNEVSFFVKGGDAAASFRAEFRFDKNGVLSRRKVYSSEFPTEAWEETKYTFNTNEN